MKGQRKTMDQNPENNTNNRNYDIKNGNTRKVIEKGKIKENMDKLKKQQKASNRIIYK